MVLLSSRLVLGRGFSLGRGNFLEPTPLGNGKDHGAAADGQIEGLAVGRRGMCCLAHCVAAHRLGRI